MDSPARLRMSRTALIPVGLLALCAVPLAFAAPWTPRAAAASPLAVAVWVLRAGVDIGDDGLTVRSLAGERRVPWSELAGIRVAPPRRALAGHHRAGRRCALPVMRARDLPRLAALSGGRIDVPAPPPDQ